MKITDKKIIDTIKQIDEEDEHIMTDVFKILLYNVLETRKLLKKDKPKVYKRPTNNKNDIIVGK